MRREGSEMIDEIKATLGLNEAELADLRCHASAERLLDLVRTLGREIKASRIPEITRTKDEWLGGRTILETIACDGVEPVYDYLRCLFSYERI